MFSEAKKRIKSVTENPLQAFVTDKFQLFDTIETVLSEIGACHMIITSFSVSEEFIRKIYRFKDSGLVLSASAVIDHKASAKISKLLSFSSNVFNRVYLGSNHSKVVLLWNRDTRKEIAIITSQNLTRGNRQESTVITSDPLVYLNLSHDVATIIDNAVEICSQNQNSNQ